MYAHPVEDIFVNFVRYAIYMLRKGGQLSKQKKGCLPCHEIYNPHKAQTLTNSGSRNKNASRNTNCTSLSLLFFSHIIIILFSKHFHRTCPLPCAWICLARVSDLFASAFLFLPFHLIPPPFDYTQWLYAHNTNTQVYRPSLS